MIVLKLGSLIQWNPNYTEPAYNGNLSLAGNVYSSEDLDTPLPHNRIQI